MNSISLPVLQYSVKRVGNSQNPDENWGYHCSTYEITDKPKRIMAEALTDQSIFKDGRKVSIQCPVHHARFECLLASRDNICLHHSSAEKKPSMTHIYQKPVTFQFHGRTLTIKIDEAHEKVVEDALRWAQTLNKK